MPDGWRRVYTDDEEQHYCPDHAGTYWSEARVLQSIIDGYSLADSLDEWADERSAAYGDEEKKLGSKHDIAWLVRVCRTFATQEMSLRQLLYEIATVASTEEYSAHALNTVQQWAADAIGIPRRTAKNTE
jgi:hypothetical protein